MYMQVNNNNNNNHATHNTHDDLAALPYVSSKVKSQLLTSAKL